MQGLVIEKVSEGSVAEELEIEPGDRLVSINGHFLRDIIDFNYHAGDESLTLEILKKDGERWEMEVELEEGESLGLYFPAPVPAQCGNRCLFCFVHQLPKGLRTPLYVKDEDYRLSFLYGNYVTLSNIDETDMDRIIQQRLSPLYISVHATDPVLRQKLLGRGNILPILEIMEKLAHARITMHTQIVLCPGLNDGEQLQKTVDDLARLHPLVASVAVVPLGLTSHRQGLPSLMAVDEGYAAAFVREWEPKARELAEKLGSQFLFLADEFYIKGNLPFPSLEAYGDLPQIENGVGMIPLFLEEAREVLDYAEPLPPHAVTVVTGESPYRYLSRFIEALAEKTGITMKTIAVRNLLFGETVTVTGLVSGRDIIEGLKGKDLGDLLFVPDVMLKEGEGVFLDDLAVEDLENTLGVEVKVVEATPNGIYQALRDMVG